MYLTTKGLVQFQGEGDVSKTHKTTKKYSILSTSTSAQITPEHGAVSSLAPCWSDAE